MSELNNNINIKDIQDDSNNQDFYKNFKEKLIEVEQFPTIYTFKFIVKTDSNQAEQVKALFTHASAKFSEKKSSGGKYTSISIENYVNSADEVVDYYKKVGEIPVFPYPSMCD
jgi:putative lipoic acid-binding regulatory protein